MKYGAMAILGCPNVGKSTLVNALVKQKVAIVSDKPQTTRTRVLGVAHFPEGQLVLLDTPGLHRPWHRLNKRMVQASLDTIQEADLLAIMVDGQRLPGPGDRLVLEQVAQLLKERPPMPLFLLINKVDLIRKSKVLPIIEAYQHLMTWTEIVPLSAKTTLNLDRLLDIVIKKLPEVEGAYDEDFVTDQSMRHLAGEMIREKVLIQTRAELPYAVAVTVEQYEEEDRVVRIAAAIFVEKDSQKGIVIGKGGERLKTIGSEARRDIEAAIGKKVYMELFVKVQATWRDNERILSELGY
ncbi:MAG: GTPase Era [Nitrospirales bacterium]|nr:GTPase Era [Nitrospirales bacterium]